MQPSQIGTMRDQGSSSDTATAVGISRVLKLTVMITDMANSSQFAERFGARAAFRKRQRHNAILSPFIAKHRGVFVEVVGDSLLAVFPHAADAVRCSVDIQNKLADENRRTLLKDRDCEIHVRIGLHTGMVLVHRDDKHIEVVGSGVNVAARVEAADDKRTDQVLVSDSTVKAIGSGDGIGFCFAYIRRLRAKGIGNIRLFRLLWRTDACFGENSYGGKSRGMRQLLGRGEG